MTWDEEEIVKGMHRITNAERVIEYVKEPLQEIIHYEGERNFLVASNDLLMLLIFTNIDLLGYFYRGCSKAHCAVEFIREYLGRVDSRYKEVGGLLYLCLRHGMVHLVTPKRIELEDGKILDFSFRRSGEREKHLKIVKYPDLKAAGTAPDIYRLELDIPLLYRDLISAIDEYEKDIRNIQELSDVFRKAFETRRSPDKESILLTERSSYIKDSGFTFVKEQISKL